MLCVLIFWILVCLQYCCGFVFLCLWTEVFVLFRVLGCAYMMAYCGLGMFILNLYFVVYVIIVFIQCVILFFGFSVCAFARFN